jgi:uncharacterized protein YmfQ (DUF2313 family)
MTADDFLAQMQALLPPGKAWSRESSSIITKVLEGCAPEFARVQARADQALIEANPLTTEEMLDEWEYLLGLPDPCAAAPTTTAGRQAAIAAKLIARIGHNAADYEAICEALGHAGAEVVARPYEPFAVGSGYVGAPLYDDQWAHVFFVGYMTNLVTDPADFDAGWSDESGAATVDADAGYAPDGSLTADRISDGSGWARAYEISGADAPAGEAEFSVWLRSESGIVSDVQVGLVSSEDSEYETFDVDETWNRFVVRCTPDAADYYAVISSSSGGAVLAWGASIAEVDAVLECRMFAATQAHALPVFGRIGEFQPALDYFVVSEAGEFVVDSSGYFLTI